MKSMRTWPGSIWTETMAVIEINWNPDRRRLRTFGIICLIAFGVIGAWVFFRHSLIGFEITARTATNTAYALWLIGGFCVVLAAAAPAALRPLYVTLTAVTLPIGFVISHAVLAAVYYLVLTPIGLILRLIGWDPLCRRFDRDAKSYWVRHESVTDVKRYYRQF